LREGEEDWEEKEEVEEVEEASERVERVRARPCPGLIGGEAPVVDVEAERSSGEEGTGERTRKTSSTPSTSRSSLASPPPDARVPREREG
jgi:hypothetical protein